jgi:prolipoprotein diacylglyceryltransferase
MGAVTCGETGYSGGPRCCVYHCGRYRDVVSGSERIVFYQTAIAGVSTTAVLGFASGSRDAALLRMIDVAVVGIGVFLIFGRLGCHSVGCCHGRPARTAVRRLVTYDQRHIAVGFWPRYAQRGLWPIQLFESVLSALCVVVALAGSATPGRAALIYTVAYDAARLLIEFARGCSKASLHPRRSCRLQ